MALIFPNSEVPTNCSGLINFTYGKGQLLANDEAILVFPVPAYPSNKTELSWNSPI